MASTSGTTTPFFGCKISLISKSEIRYEGILYTIDPKESTIALAKVRSFGSEERPVERYVPPRDDIFEFIIFRASDIKDLIVDEPPQTLQPTLADPAIIQAQHSASTSTSFPTAFSQSISGTAQQGQQTALEKLQQKAAKGSGAIPKKHSADTQGDSKTTSKSSSSSGASGQNAQPKQSSSGRQQSLHFTNKQTHQPRLEQQQQQQQGGGNAHHNQHSGPRGYGPRLHRQNGFMENLMMGEHGGYSNNFHRGGPQQNFHQHGGNRFSPRPDNQQHGSGFGGRGGGGGGFRRGGFTGGPGTIGQRKFVPRPISHPTAVKFPPLPDGDFDFEKAQEDFKLLEEKLNALKMNGPLPGTSESGDEAPVAEIPEIPGVPAAAIAVAVLEEEANPKEPCYDKTKSFFDSISCQALEREKGNNQRIDWKVERKLNRETFGVVSARRPGFYRANNRGGGFGGPNYNQGIRAAN